MHHLGRAVLYTDAATIMVKMTLAQYCKSLIFLTIEPPFSVEFMNKFLIEIRVKRVCLSHLRCKLLKCVKISLPSIVPLKCFEIVLHEVAEKVEIFRVDRKVE